MALTGVNDGKPLLAHHPQHSLNRLDGGTGEGKVVAHLIDVAPLTAEIGLHIDNDQGRIFGAQITVKRVRIGVSGNIASHGQN